MMLIPHPDWPGAQHPGNQAHQNREHTTGADSCPSYRSTAQHTRHPIEFRPGWEIGTVPVHERLLQSPSIIKIGERPVTLGDI